VARCDIGIAQQFPPALESDCPSSTRADVAQLVEQPIRKLAFCGFLPRDLRSPPTLHPIFGFAQEKSLGIFGD
jgi:hypothetical protein